MAAEDSELSAIASANYALASFEVGDTSGAIRSARQLLRRCSPLRLLLLLLASSCTVRGVIRCRYVCGIVCTGARHARQEPAEVLPSAAHQGKFMGCCVVLP